MSDITDYDDCIKSFCKHNQSIEISPENIQECDLQVDKSYIIVKKKKRNTLSGIKEYFIVYRAFYVSCRIMNNCTEHSFVLHDRTEVLFVTSDELNGSLYPVLHNYVENKQ